MFKVLGLDQKEYGPASAEQVREWIAQGRANAETRLQAAGSAEWKPLSEFPEFAEALKHVPPGVLPAPLPAAAAAPATATQPKASGMAVASLVLGILGLLTCGITSIAGLVLGLVAMSRISKSKGQMGGSGLALSGTIVSAAFLLLMPAFGAAMLLPALARAKQQAVAIQCMTNVKQLNLALFMYADSNQNHLPAGSNWCDVLQPYVATAGNPFLCSLGKPAARSHYGFNANLSGLAVKEIQSPAHTVLVFEIEGGWDVSGGKELLPAKTRHGGAYLIGFADGHVEVIKAGRLNRLRWEP